MIFISYRRNDAAGYAGRLFDRLASRFGRDRVFMDVDTILPGEDFARTISARVGSCSALIALIGDQWVSAADDTGHQRLNDPNDFVRAEIISALERGIPIFPVLVEGARMPSPKDLPEPLQPLARHQAMELSDSRFDQEAQDLIRAIEQRAAVSPAGRGRHGWLHALWISVALLAGIGAWFLFRPHAPPPDVSGNWLAEVSGPGGATYPITLELRVAGDRLLGAVTYPTGSGQIEEGRVEGTRVTFETRHVPQFETEPATIRFTGELVNDELRLTMQSHAGLTDLVARRGVGARGPAP
jgi:hypothetical protein